MLNAFKPELSNGAVMDIGIYTLYPLVALFGRPRKIEAMGTLLSTGVDGQGAVNLLYDGFIATVLYSKIADSALPTEIEGEDGNIVLDSIHMTRQVTFSPRGNRQSAQSLGVGLDKDVYYYEMTEFMNLVEQGSIESAINSHQTSLITMEIIDEIRKQIGVTYPADSV